MSRIDRAIRVNHAGEYGAVRIYEGQLAVLGRSPSASTLRRMRAQEVEHLTYFTQALQEHAVRPTVLLPFWHVGAYALGLLTARWSNAAAMACTEAVEDVVERHYAGQLTWIPPSDASLRAAVTTVRNDELEHRDWAISSGSRGALGYAAIYRGISRLCRAAIWLSERL